jgi:hypothetical protein
MAVPKGTVKSRSLEAWCKKAPERPPKMTRNSILSEERLPPEIHDAARQGIELAKGERGKGRGHKGDGDNIKRQVGICEGKRRPHDEQQNKGCTEQARAAVQEEYDRQGKDGEGSGIRQQQDHQSDGHPGDIFPLHETTWQFSSQKYFAYGRYVKTRL